MRPLDKCQSKNEPFIHPSLPHHSLADRSKTGLADEKGEKEEDEKEKDEKEKDEKEEGEKGESSEREPPPAKPRRQSAAGEVGGESARKPEKSQPQPRSSPRPFQQALQALNRLTAAAGKPHDGVSTAVSSFSSLSSVTTGCGRIGSEVAQARAAHVPRRPSTPSTDGSSSGRRGSVTAGGGGGGGSSSSAGERCRVGFDIIRLLTGPDGNDAGGRPVGVRPGEDVKAAVLNGGRSQVDDILLSSMFAVVSGRGGHHRCSSRRFVQGGWSLACGERGVPSHAWHRPCASGFVVQPVGVGVGVFGGEHTG